MFRNASLDVDGTIKSMAELAGAGVTYATVNLPGDTRGELLDNIREFGEAVLPAVARL
jgi:hypothetical protein